MLKHVSLLGTLHIQITPVGKLALGRVWYLLRVTSMIGERWGLGNMGESVSTTPDSLLKVLEADHPFPCSDRPTSFSADVGNLPAAPCAASSAHIGQALQINSL